MADLRIRQLERAAATGDREALVALRHARKRLKVTITHFVPEHLHQFMGSDDQIGLSTDRGGWPIDENELKARCGVSIWPRALWNLKKLSLTIKKDATTCKSCIRSFNRKKGPYLARRHRVHYLPREAPGKTPSCGRTYAPLETEELTQDKNAVTCRQCCHRIFYGWEEACVDFGIVR